LQAKLELEHALILDGHDAGDARRLDPEVGERDPCRAGQLDAVLEARRDSSDTSVVMSASSSAEVMRSPSISAAPMTSAVRPTASATPMLANSSRTR
jgi:hypothetical protein